MRLRYSLTRWDLFRAGLRGMLHQRIVLIVLIPLLAFIAWSTFTYDENRKLAVPVRITVAIFSATMCAGVGILGGAAVVAAQSFFRRDTGVLGEHTLEIADNGLIESTDVNSSLANWRTRFRIRETGRYAYIYISVNHAHIIPKARPPLEGSVAEFLRELRERIAMFQRAAASNGGNAARPGSSGVGEGPPSAS